MYEETRKRIYRLLASNYAGLENISEDGKKTMVAVEKKASEFALSLLLTAMDEETMAKATYNSWLNGYLQKAGIEDPGVFLF